MHIKIKLMHRTS